MHNQATSVYWVNDGILGMVSNIENASSYTQGLCELAFTYLGALTMGKKGFQCASLSTMP